MNRSWLFLLLGVLGFVGCSQPKASTDHSETVDDHTVRPDVWRQALPGKWRFLATVEITDQTKERVFEIVDVDGSLRTTSIGGATGSKVYDLTSVDPDGNVVFENTIDPLTMRLTGSFNGRDRLKGEWKIGSGLLLFGDWRAERIELR